MSASKGLRLIVLAVVSIVATSCGSAGDAELVVSAASSLSDSFTEIEAAFEAENPGVDVVLNFGASPVLANQIIEGAPVDVFASASIQDMELLVEEGRADGFSVFARNFATIGVPFGNPAGVEDIEDLETVSLLGVCAPQVPCGVVASEVFAKAELSVSPSTLEPNARALVTKLEESELDAGIVYVSDAVSGRVDSIDIPDEFQASTDYPIATLVEAEDQSLAGRFVEFVEGSQGLDLLAENGFSTP